MDGKAKKDKSVKFVLAPRPQRDPLAADFEAPQHVLVPKGGLSVEEVREKFPDLDQKLFESKGETRVGMLERAHQADGMVFDPDVLQAMSKDFDFEDPNNILDDDFIDQAGGLIEDEGEMLDNEMTDLTKDLFEDDPELVEFGSVDEDDDEDEKYDCFDSDEEDLDEQLNKSNIKINDDIFGSGKRLIMFKKKSTQRGIESDHNRQDHQRNEDNKSVFTNYSMTSSVMRRSQGLQQIDEHFERLYEKEYADDTEIGALDLNDVKGDELLKNIDQIKEMKKEVKITRMLNHGGDYEPEIVSNHHENAIIGDEPDAEDEDLVEVEFQRRENRVDCESILSYNSNLYNHPKLIVEPRKRTASHNTALSNRMDADSDSDQRSRSEVSRSMASTRATVLSKLSHRPENETPEEKRARKKALKAYKHERRQERKQNREIFKAEKANIIKQQRTNKPALRLA